MQNEKFSVRSNSSITNRQSSSKVTANGDDDHRTSDTELQQLVNRSNQLERSKLYRKFYWFSFIMSLNHSVNYIVIAYSTALLGDLMGSMSLGLSFLSASFASLFIANMAIHSCGFRASVLIALWGYAIQDLALFLAVILSSASPGLAWMTTIIGSLIGGSAAIWWTTQGIYFNYIALEMVKHTSDMEQTILQPPSGSNPYSHLSVTTTFDRGSSEPAQEGGQRAGSSSDENSCQVSTADIIRANLSADWTLIYQGCNMLMFLCLSVVPIALGLPLVTMIAVVAVVGAGTALLGVTLDDVGTASGDLTWSEVVRSAQAIPDHFKEDARAGLLLPFQVLIAAASAMMYGFMNASVISKYSSLGELSIGFIEAYVYLIAIVAAYPFAHLSQSHSYGKHWIMRIGTGAVLLSGVLVLSLPNRVLASYGMLFVVKGLFGVGRGIFEGTNRELYASLFQGQLLAVAFSGQCLVYTLALALFFFLLFALTKTSVSLLVVAISLVTIIANEWLVCLLSVEGLREIISWSKLTSWWCSSPLAKGGEQVTKGGRTATATRGGCLVEPLL